MSRFMDMLYELRYYVIVRLDNLSMHDWAIIALSLLIVGILCMKGMGVSRA